jgi:hypothetical protein
MDEKKPEGRRRQNGNIGAKMTSYARHRGRCIRKMRK